MCNGFALLISVKISANKRKDIGFLLRKRKDDRTLWFRRYSIHDHRREMGCASLEK
ncbi:MULTISPECIES: DUF4102 domain-containing protein [unclassified Bartonella]|uniref:DUF4102 domain-containing protein n=1 Tax=unclassified Bartonella TaxID=2645622 RepID=UPI0035CEF0A8